MIGMGSVVTVTEQVTFGRDAAMFESLLGFVAQLSFVLWAVVLLTLIARFVGVFLYRRGGLRADLARNVAPADTVPATAATSTFDELLQPAGTSASAAPSARNAALSARKTHHAPVLATSSSGW